MNFREIIHNDWIKPRHVRLIAYIAVFIYIFEYETNDSDKLCGWFSQAQFIKMNV